MVCKLRTFTNTNLIVGGQHLLDLLREPGTSSDPQVRVVTTAPTKAEAIKTLAHLGLPCVRPAALQVNELYLAVVTLRDAGLLTEGRAFVFRDYRHGCRVVELLGKDRATVIGIFVLTGEYRLQSPLALDLIVAD